MNIKIFFIFLFLIFYFVILISIVSFRAEQPTMDKKTFEEKVNESGILEDLPEDQTILLSFYHVEAGELKIDDSLILSKDDVHKKTPSENSDISIMIPSSSMNTTDFCSMLRDSKENNQLYFSTNLSTQELMWKFRKFGKYLYCIT